MRQLATAGNALAPGLLSGSVTKYLASDALPDGVVAPYDVTRLLGMLTVGARGETLREFQRVLAFDADPITWPNVFYTLNAALLQPTQDTDNGNVKTAAAWFGQDQYAFDKNYLDTLSAAYRVDHSLWNFAALDPYFSVPLRSWVEMNTDAQLSERLLIDHPASGRVVQSSVTQISTGWNTQDYEVSEFTGLFERRNGTQIRLPMLRIEGMLSSADHRDFSAVKLPLAIPEWELWVVTPQPDRFEEVERDLVALLPSDADWTVTSSRVTLPMFTFQSNYNLRNYLQGRGLNLAFEEHVGSYPPRADFSGINGQGYVYLAGVAGGASISIGATGLRVAGSASAVLAATGDEPASVWHAGSGSLGYGATWSFADSVLCPLVYVKAGDVDATPFLIVVRHAATGTILNLGRAVRLSGEEAGRWEEQCPQPTYVVPDPIPVVIRNDGLASGTLTNLTAHP